MTSKDVLYIERSLHVLGFLIVCLDMPRKGLEDYVWKCWQQLTLSGVIMGDFFFSFLHPCILQHFFRRHEGYSQNLLLKYVFKGFILTHKFN